MIDVAISGGDLIVSSYGDISLEFTDNDDIIQMANDAIQTVKGENIFHPEYGNDAWNHRLKISKSGFEIVQECASEAILYADSRVKEVTSIVAYQDEDSEYGCIVEYQLLTTDGRTISSSTNINIL